MNKMINFSTFAIIFKNVFRIFLKPVVRSVLKYRQRLVQFFKIRLACNYFCSCRMGSTFLKTVSSIDYFPGYWY